MFKRINLAWLIVVLVSAVLASPASAAPPRSYPPAVDGATSDRHLFPGGVFTSSGQQYAPNRLLVRYRDGVTPTLRAATRGLIEAKVKRSSALVPGLETLNLPHGVDPVTAAAALSRQPSVEYAIPDFAYHVDTTPDDPSYTDQWALPQIGAPSAWQRSTGSHSVVVAVLDTGVDRQHPDLQANLVPGWNFVADNDDPTDDHGHGTHVAGIIGAVGNNGLGVAGVNWSVGLMPLKICDSHGSCYLSDEVSALDFAVSHGATVANASFGGTYGGWQPEQDAIAAAGKKGLLYVAGAGNAGESNDVDPFYPASYPLDNIISVGASGTTDTLTDFSNYGPSSVDLVAPGADILSTYPGGYATLSGTSMAAPFVTGAAALVRSLHPDWSVTKTRKRLLGTAQPVSALAGRVDTCGRLNLAAATSSAATKATLCVAKTGTATGSVVSSAAGIDCGVTCASAYTAGTVVTLTATPDAGATFAGWSGACTGSDPCTVTMSSVTTVTARFRRSSTQAGWSNSPLAAPAGRDPLPPGSRTGDYVGSFFNVALSANGLVRAKTVYDQPQYCYYDSSDTGGVYLERKTSSGWVSDGMVTAPNVGSDAGARWTACNAFGEITELSADGSTLLVGQPMSPVWVDSTITYRCVAFVYRHGSTGWKLEGKLYPKGIGAGGAAGVEGCGYFGQQGVISADGTRVAILATQPPSGPDGARAPRADVFVRTSSAWTRETSLLMAPCGGPIGFRWLAMSGDGSSVLLSNPECNVVEAFQRSGSTWTLTQTIAPPTTDDAWFGTAVAISADGLTATIASAFHWDAASWVYQRVNGTWQSRTRLLRGVATTSDWWDDGLSFDCRAIVRGGTRIICGAFDSIGYNDFQGSLYVFNEPAQGWAAGATPNRLFVADGLAFDRLSSTAQVWRPTIAAREDGTRIDVPINVYNLASGGYPHDRIGYEFRR